MAQKTQYDPLNANGDIQNPNYTQVLFIPIGLIFPLGIWFMREIVIYSNIFKIPVSIYAYIYI